MKAELQLPFSWIFAIIIGIFILSLAIFSVYKLMDVSETQHQAETSREFQALLNPIEVGFETGKSNLISFPVSTVIYNSCDSLGNFGNQKISTTQESFGKQQDSKINISLENRYLFSEKQITGKDFYVFSKPFYFPFKVADLNYITPSDKIYCFRDAPEEIRKEISNLNQDNLKIGNCKQNDIVICFSGSCKIRVDLADKKVIKGNQSLYFETTALMYAAIFSDKEIYECQIKRLMKRTKELSVIYLEKSRILSRECSSENIAAGLAALASQAPNLENSAELFNLYRIVNEISSANDISLCKFW